MLAEDDGAASFCPKLGAAGGTSGSAGIGCEARLLFLVPADVAWLACDAIPDGSCAFVGARRLKVLSAIAAAAPTGLGGRDGCPGPNEGVDDAPTAVDVRADAPVASSCRSFASIRAILESVLRHGRSQPVFHRRRLSYEVVLVVLAHHRAESGGINSPS